MLKASREERRKTWEEEALYLLHRKVMEGEVVL
jgi:hypothetical protein